jgi:hypothetical protein
MTLMTPVGSLSYIAQTNKSDSATSRTEQWDKALTDAATSSEPNPYATTGGDWGAVGGGADGAIMGGALLSETGPLGMLAGGAGGLALGGMAGKEVGSFAGREAGDAVEDAFHNNRASNVAAGVAGFVTGAGAVELGGVGADLLRGGGDVELAADKYGTSATTKIVHPISAVSDKIAMFVVKSLSSFF